VSDTQWGAIGVLKATIIGRLSVSMMAAGNIAETVMSLCMVFTQGLSAAACVIIGKTIGQGDLKKTREYSGTIQILAFLSGLLMAGAVTALRAGAVSLYNIAPETAVLARRLMFIGGLTMIGTCYHVACFCGINRGGGDSRFVFIVDMVSGWLVVLPLAFLSAFVWRLSMAAVFLAIRIDQCYKWLLALLRLRGTRWIHDVTKTDP